MAMCVNSATVLASSISFSTEDEPPKSSPRHAESSSNNNNNNQQQQQQLRQRHRQNNNDAPRSRRSLSPLLSKASVITDVGCPEKYVTTKRTMTPFQERVNAITILPSTIFCFYYMLSSQWLLPETLQRAAQSMSNVTTTTPNNNHCIDSAWFPHFHYAPPPAVLAICMGIIFHCPCSFIYHWCAAKLPTADQRLHHWSRKLDQSAIHACSNFWAYAITASTPFTLLNIVYNVDSIYRLCCCELNPRRNQLRIAGSIIIYTLPLILWLEQHALFYTFWLYTIVALWLFAAYPVGGWSHTAFHMVMLLVPPLVLEFASTSEAQGDWALAAAHCALAKGVPSSSS